MSKILIVDDDRAFRLSTAALLRADGYEVDCVADGAAAADALRTTRHDLVVLDLRMPGVDGLGVVEALRLWGERVPILMISGFGTVESAVRALHLGADDFLTKPVEPDVLSDRVGVFEAAIGGTIFLDEIGEMSVVLQQRLLRVLQEREVTRVGSSRAVKVDVRAVAATNRDLGELVAQGRFREDLYYRLAVFPIALPPLRERRADIPLLVEHALSILRTRREGGDRLVCSPLAMRLLRNYDWPGNVRQLFGVIERAAVEAEYG